MARKDNDCSPDADDLVREFCRENDIGKMAACPKCAMEADPLSFFCQHQYCPIREWIDHHGT